MEMMQRGRTGQKKLKKNPKKNGPDFSEIVEQYLAY